MGGVQKGGGVGNVFGVFRKNLYTSNPSFKKKPCVLDKTYLSSSTPGYMTPCGIGWWLV